MKTETKEQSSAVAAKELLPCPFCKGDRPEPVEVFDFIRKDDEKKMNLRHIVRCFDCGAQTRDLGSEAAAIEKWNTRYQPSLSEGADCWKWRCFLLCQQFVELHNPALCEATNQNRKCDACEHFCEISGELGEWEPNDADYVKPEWLINLQSRRAPLPSSTSTREAVEEVQRFADYMADATYGGISESRQAALAKALRTLIAAVTKPTVSRGTTNHVAAIALLDRWAVEPATDEEKEFYEELKHTLEHATPLDAWRKVETVENLPQGPGDYLFKRRLVVPDQDMGDLAYEFKRLDDPYFTTLFSTNHNKEVFVERFSHWQEVGGPSGD